MPGNRPPSPLEELERHRSALAGIRTGVIEMEQSPSYLMLVDAKPGTVTAKRYGPAVAEAGDIWLIIDALAARIEAGQALVERHNLSSGSGDHRRLAELGGLLAQPIDQPTGRAKPTTVRDGLDTARQRYDAVQHGVARIDHLWLTVLPRIEAARATADRLDREVAELGVVEPLIGRARRTADDLAHRLMSDPISIADGEGLDLDRLVNEAARHVATLRSGFETLDDDLDRTEEVLAGLRVLRSRAEATTREVALRITEAPGGSAVPAAAIIDGPGGLAEQLDEVFAVARRSDRTQWTRQRVILDSWLDKADRLRRQLEAAEAANRRPLDRRDELRGRLQAFQAKMAATGRAESPEAMTLADEAWTELYTAPTDLDRAADGIGRLAAELRKS